MPNLKQEHRELSIETPLGEDALLVVCLIGREEIGRPFSYDVEVLSESSDVAFEDLLGQGVTVALNVAEQPKRFFHGIVNRVQSAGVIKGLARYRLSLVPWLWLLTRRTDCRIFQEKTVPDIIKEVFRANGFSDFDEKLTGSYRTWEYCVQYNESDFNFVSRLMEQEGIYYFFTHERGKHTLVLADSVSAHTPIDDDPQVPFYPPGTQARERSSVSVWETCKQIQPGAVAMRDFDFTKPRDTLDAQLSQPKEHKWGDAEVFDYPGAYVAAAEGDTYSTVRLQESHTRYEESSGQCDVLTMLAGRTFTLTDPSNVLRSDQLREYLVTGMSVHAVVSEYFAGTKGDDSQPFACRFAAIPFSQQFRAARMTPKPLIRGPQTAMVVTANDEDLQVDEHARVRVKFHWDRYGDPTKGDTSCWIRVAQVWAGKKWGGIFIPRKGQEVVVEFLEGDPDRPIITGRVYNGECQPPYPLPDQKTVSSLKSLSTPDGGNFNELYFDDKKENEVLFLRAAKDMTQRVLNRLWEFVGESRHTIVEKDSYEEIKNERHLKVKKDNFEEYSTDRHITVTGKQAHGVDGSMSVTVGGDVNEAFKANQTTEVTSDLKIQAMNFKVTGMTSIKLECGGSSIEMTPGSITIKAPALTVQAAATFAMPVTINAPTTVAAPVTIAAALTVAGPITSAGPVTATSIVSPTYTPGAGNIV